MDAIITTMVEQQGLLSVPLFHRQAAGIEHFALLNGDRNNLCLDCNAAESSDWYRKIDLTGQVCADPIGTRIFSGTGGQLDFVRGAKMSKGGKAIIALASRTNKGVSKIVPVLKPGAGVVTPRADIQWVVTEYGAVNLYGKSLQERVKLLINVAHPEDRCNLEKKALERFQSHYYEI